MEWLHIAKALPIGNPSQNLYSLATRSTQKKIRSA